MTLKNHRIKIELINSFTDEIIGKRETGDIEVAQQILGSIEQWIKNDEYGCIRCGEKMEILSEINEHLYCQTCIEALVEGETL